MIFTQWLCLTPSVRRLFLAIPGDIGLPQLVVFECQVPEQTLGIVGRVLHRHHPRTFLIFNLGVLASAKSSVHSVTYDTTVPGLFWSANPNRFSIGAANGITPADISFSRTNSTFTVTFKKGKFGANDSIRFGMSVFAPIEGSAEEDPERFAGTTVTVTFDDGTTKTGTFTANPQAAC